MGAFPSGQRGQTVNLLSLTSVVRIHPLPPIQKTTHRVVFCIGRARRTRQSMQISRFGNATTGYLLNSPAASSVVRIHFGRGRRTQVCRFRRKPKWRCSAAKANLVRSAPRAERGGPNPGGEYHRIKFVSSIPPPPIFRFGAKRNIATVCKCPPHNRSR